MRLTLQGPDLLDALVVSLAGGGGEGGVLAVPRLLPDLVVVSVDGDPGVELRVRMVRRRPAAAVLAVRAAAHQQVWSLSRFKVSRQFFF